MKIVLNNLSKHFPSRDKKNREEVIAVDKFNFEIPDGKLVGLLGPSGCGKSTTLNLISGLETPTMGDIYFGVDNVTKLPPEKRGVGLVFQSYALYPHLNVYKNVRFPLENLKGKNKLSKEEMNKRVVEAAKLVQIEQLLERKPNELSGGQQQRVAIARALVKMPRVLLLDEPLSNLDARLRIQTREEIRRIQTETGITTIFVTHDQEEAMSISDYIIVMKDGKFQQMGMPQEVYDNPCNLFVAKFLGTPPINVFIGEIRNGSIYIQNECILKTNSKTLQNQFVYIAIRPEGFIYNSTGEFTCDLDRIEVMGRDVSVVARHDMCMSETKTLRAIINSDIQMDLNAKKVSFSVKKNKIYLFNKATEERIYFEVEE